MKLVNKIIQYFLSKVELDKKTSKINRLIQEGILTIGYGTYQYELLEIDIYKGSEARIVFGKYCSLAKNIRIITGGIHPPTFVSTYPFRIKLGFTGAYSDGIPSTKGDVIIGNDVWIGTNATILSGVNIGNGAVIASNAIVTKDVPDYAIVAGNPAKVLKYRFLPNQIEALNSINWWDWPEEKISTNVELFSSSNIDEFISKHQFVK